MSTRSMIAVEMGSGTVISSYVHYDGYVSRVGLELLESFDNFSYAVEICDYGYFSALPNWGKWYLGEFEAANTSKPHVDSSLKSFIGDFTTGYTDIEYIYVYRKSAGGWFYAKVKELTPESGVESLKPLTFATPELLEELEHSLEYGKKGMAEHPVGSKMYKYYASGLGYYEDKIAEIKEKIAA